MAGRDDEKVSANCAFAVANERLLDQIRRSRMVVEGQPPAFRVRDRDGEPITARSRRFGPGYFAIPPERLGNFPAAEVQRRDAGLPGASR